MKQGVCNKDFVTRIYGNNRGFIVTRILYIKLFCYNDLETTATLNCYLLLPTAKKTIELNHCNSVSLLNSKRFRAWNFAQVKRKLLAVFGGRTCLEQQHTAPWCKHLPMCPVKHQTHALKVILEETTQRKLFSVRPKTLRRRKKKKTLAITKRYALKRKRKKKNMIHSFKLTCIICFTLSLH